MTGKKFFFRDYSVWILSMVFGVVGFAIGYWANFEKGLIFTTILGIVLGICIDDFKETKFFTLLILCVFGYIINVKITNINNETEFYEKKGAKEKYLSGWNKEIDNVLLDYLNGNLSINLKKSNIKISSNDKILYLRNDGTSKTNNPKDKFTISDCILETLKSNNFNLSINSNFLDYIILENIDLIKEGNYDNGNMAYSYLYRIDIIDFKNRIIIVQESFAGGKPPHLKSESESGYGDKPTYDYQRFISSKFAFSNFKCD